MLYQHLIEGGFWWMLPIYIMWIVVIVLTIVLAFQHYKNNNNQKLKPLRELILFMGSFTFLFSILGQAIGIMQMMDCINQAGDIAPALIAMGFKITMLSTTYGFVLFILSYLVWFVSKKLSN